ncbi:MAG TPA: hypothetical protein VFH89_08405 [Sphingomicrobium sp.]|nr:hypothetical protein [Sphingomicrobium sp.]
MSKRAWMIAAMALLFVPGIAFARDKLEPRVQAMLACEAVSASEARLQCYDQAMSAFKQAMAQGNVVVKEKDTPMTLGGVIKASGQSGSNRYWVEFENGDRWTLMPSKSRRGPPAPGSTAKLSRTLMGNYYFSAPNWPQTEARFVGHGS